MSPKSSAPKHVIVDGSNIATEGRSKPSLKQLNEAVMAFISDHPKAVITVIVDATFGHRIDPKEVAAFDKAVEHNELVTPPAGTVGRGDGFVLSIAQKVGASILSNDSYQEFHDQYSWLFDNGRLIGGKPVPHVGWVFVDRLPVRVKSESSPQRGVPNKTAPIPRPAARSAGRQAERPSSRPAPRPTRPGARLPESRSAGSRRRSPAQTRRHPF